jgi:hypothetical protein
VHYELWDMLSRNMLADFGSEAEALAEIRDLLELNPAEMMDELVLIWRDGEQGGTLAEGAELADRARATGPSRDALSS